MTPSPETLEEKKASSGLMETKIIFFPGRYDSIRDRQLILERPWKEARSPGQAVAVGTEHKDPQVPKEDNRGFLWEPGSTVLFWSATNCDSFTVSVSVREKWGDGGNKMIILLKMILGFRY